MEAASELRYLQDLSDLLLYLLLPPQEFQAGPVRYGNQVRKSAGNVPTCPALEKYRCIWDGR
jgi:hypothetical protein